MLRNVKDLTDLFEGRMSAYQLKNSTSYSSEYVYDPDHFTLIETQASIENRKREEIRIREENISNNIIQGDFSNSFNFQDGILIDDFSHPVRLSSAFGDNIFVGRYKGQNIFVNQTRNTSTTKYRYLFDHNNISRKCLKYEGGGEGRVSYTLGTGINVLEVCSTPQLTFKFGEVLERFSISVSVEDSSGNSYSYSPATCIPGQNVCNIDLFPESIGVHYSHLSKIALTFNSECTDGAICFLEAVGITPVPEPFSMISLAFGTASFIKRKNFRFSCFKIKKP